MSFPRAEVKRFNEQEGCAPPPGHYNVSEAKQATGVLPFKTGGERFKLESDSSSDNVSDTSSQLSTSFLAPNAPSSKKKLNFAAPDQSKPRSTKSTPHASPSVSNKEKREYEKEIRRLLQQVNEQDKKICSKTQEIQKLEARMSSISKEKTSLIAQVASAERKTVELEKKSAILQSKKTMENERLRKREDLEEELKKIKAKLETAKQELDKCRSLLVALQSDLESARSTISALQQSNHVLTQLNKEVQAHSDDVSTQINKLQILADTLRAEKLSSEQELLLVKNKLKNVEKEFTSLLQEKVKEIEKNFEAKQQLIVKKLEHANSELQESISKTDESQEIITKLENERVKWNQEKTELEEALKSRNGIAERLSETIQEMKEAAEASGTSMQAMKKEKVELLCGMQSLEAEIERLSSESLKIENNLKKELQLVREERDAANDSQSETKVVLNLVESEKSSLDKKVKELEDLSKVSLKKAEEANSKAEEAFHELEAAKSASLAAENEKKEIESELESLVAKLEHEARINNNLRRELENSQMEENEYKEQLVELEAKADALETELIRANDSASCAFANEESANDKILLVEERMREKETQYQAKLSEFTRRLLETQKKLNHKEEEFQSLRSAKESESQELRKLRKLMTERNGKQGGADRLSKENALLAEKVAEVQDEGSPEAGQDEAEIEELRRWKDRYNELWEKVEPFQAQIDAYAAEKSSLLSENSAAHAEMQTLGKKYAELLGHQNQKQKIRHIVKIKDENLNLKQEVAKLRSQVSRLQKQNLANRPTKFNPEDAFQHKKENATPFSHNN